MTYEEKRELRLQISQLLADAGLNQAAIKELVEKEISNKVERAVEQIIKSLDAQSVSGNYVGDRVAKILNTQAFQNAVKEELKGRIIEVKLRDVKV